MCVVIVIIWLQTDINCTHLSSCSGICPCVFCGSLYRKGWMDIVPASLIVGYIATHGGAVGWGTATTSRKVAGSIPDGVTGIFRWHNPSGRTMALGLTQPLTEMSTRNIFLGDKGGRCVGLTALPLSCADCLEICEPQPPGSLRACPGL